MGHRSWRAVHLLAYAGWAASVAHTLGIGTDVRDGTSWALLTVAGCVAVVAGAVALRLGRLVTDRLGRTPALVAGSRS